MRFLSILLLLIFSTDIFCIDIDDTINGAKEEIYYFSQRPTKNPVTYQIQKDSEKKYFEIIYFYCQITVLKEDEIIYQSNNEESGEYLYNFEHDGSNYYMTIQYTSSIAPYGFLLKSQSSEYNYILSSSETIELLKKRSFTLKIENKENEKTIICVKVPEINRIKMNENKDTKMIEDGKEIDYKYLKEGSSATNYINYFYAVLSNQISFSSIVTTEWYTTINQKSSATIYLDNYKIKEITEDTIISLKKGSFEYYKIKNNALSYFEISFLKNTELYLLESNTQKTEIKTIQRFDKNSNLFMLNSENNEGCFNIMFMDEKNSVTEDKEFTLNIFDTRDYNITIINEKIDYIKIGFKENSYVNLTKIFLPNKNVDIKSNFQDINNYYIFEFEKESSEIPVTLKFEKLKDISKYETVEFFYKSSRDIIYKIENDYFECVNESKTFLLNSNSENKCINMTFNSTEGVKLNDIKIKNRWINLNIADEKNYLYILGSKEKPICFNALYSKNGSIEIKIKETKIFKLFLNEFDDQYFDLYLPDLKEDKKYNLELFYEKDCVNIYESSLEFQNVKEKKENEYNEKEKKLEIEFTPNGKNVRFNFRLYKKVDDAKELKIYFYLKEQEKNYSSLIKISKVMSYICFAIVILPIVLICCSNNLEGGSQIKSDKNSFYIEKFLAIYACKKY